jgi:hypothetical protein
MKERDWIEPIVERVVGRVLDNHMGQLCAEIIRQVAEEIAAAPAIAGRSKAADSPSGPAELARAVYEIQMGSSQREILRALLEASSRYAARVALFVVKGSHATGWQGRGFANDAALKDFALDDKAPAVVRAISNRVVASVPVADQDARFLKEFGAPSGDGRLLPLMLKDKVAALVYADSGTDAAGLLDASSLELLVLSTGAWLEVNSLRKQAQKDPSAQSSSNAAGADAQPAVPVQTVPAFNDPFASHSPGHSMAAAASAAVAAPAMAAPAVAADPALAEPLPITPAQPAPSSTEAPPPGMSPEDQDVHRKAQRFARLLVDEIKLYNQAKVAEGRKNKDLYDRLQETIDKSRATYQKRYGSTVAASGNYFHHEIIRSLAEDDLSIMGPNFRQ